ncbi:hypothetical protein AYO21_03627 [Fonsecaea monophora]|uniref:F-box domain-containing protein n=1 Tax=Fonsecaea monophora TaxID=254056 RepID=A0A177FCZ2_9EURO|nr:hypothetical protein AYO21_03627 [Fonsecaea monophora]KAH0848009.1 hypothetical protein FOPE_01726 [Fonsecaea pedrosoi]OAG42173.1 hypothetical protein AYO21_03627 [Fonsecaea monophora]
MDGACDEPDAPTPSAVSRPSSVVDIKSQMPRPSVVHFLSDDHLNWREREHATFVNPFSPEDPSSRKTSTSSEATAYLRPNAFAGHRDTLVRLHYFTSSDHDNEDTADSDADSFSTALTRQPSRRASLAGANLDLFYPLRVVDAVLQYVAFDDFKAMRLVCRQWHANLPRPKFPGAYLVPREILKEIYSYLTPCDFDAARHTCKAWFLASLDRYVLEPMLRASGCQAALATDLERIHGSFLAERRSWDSRLGPVPADAENAIDTEWLCSRRLATESRLSPDWRGSFLPDDSAQSSRLSKIEEVDFSKVTNPPVSLTKSRFTVSACGRFVLVVSGGDISVYSLCDSEQSLVPVVRLATGFDVLKVSMDTSSERYSVAALLAGRIGMLWDLEGSHIQTRYRNNSGETMSLAMQKDIPGPANYQISTLASVNLPINYHHTHATGISDSDLAATTINDNNHPVRATPSPPFLWDEHMRSSESPEEVKDFHITDDANQVRDRLGIPIETRATTVYNNLGSVDDQPRSVAICPNRRCVAFGCRMGIELHWVDALTGGQLNRWFPLAAPSDYLYFLPRRCGMDSKRKLRLISSAAGPVVTQLVRSDSTPATSKYWPTPATFGRRQSLTRLFFGNLPFPTPVSGSGDLSGSVSPERAHGAQGVLRTVDCGHFHAVPVSDGFHLIFTDPVSGLLCLGSDAPLGGPTKLVRKIMFIPPGEGGRTPAPRRYSVGKALGWGLRLVAVYDDDQVVLYNIPSDIFGRLQGQRSSTDIWDENSGVVGQSDLIMDSLMNRDEPGPPGGPAVQEAPEHDDGYAQQPLQLAGSLIAHVANQPVDDIAVQSETGGLSVWLFYRSGLAEFYSIYAPWPHQVRRRLVGENGFICDCDNQMPVETRTVTGTTKGKERADQETRHVKWAGQGN